MKPTYETRTLTKEEVEYIEKAYYILNNLIEDEEDTEENFEN